MGTATWTQMGCCCRTMTPPKLSPSKDLLEAPIWTTWARYFSRVNEAKVLKYAHEIASRGLQVLSLCKPPVLQQFCKSVCGVDPCLLPAAASWIQNGEREC